MRCNTTMVLCVTYTILILSLTLITHSLSLSTSTETRHNPSHSAKVSLQQPGSDTHNDSPQIQPKISHPWYSQGPKYSGQNINSVEYSVPVSIYLINKWKSTAQGRKKYVGISEGSTDHLENHHIGGEETDRVVQSSSNTLSYDSSHTHLSKASRKPSLPDIEVSLTSSHVYTPTDVSRTPLHTTPAPTYSSPTQPSPLYITAFTLLNEATKNYTSLSRQEKSIPVTNSNTNSYHTPTEDFPGT